MDRYVAKADGTDKSINSAQSFARRLFSLAALLLTFLPIAPSQAGASGIEVGIDLSEQLMRVAVDRQLVAEWPVSTGRQGYATPTGEFTPQRLAAKWRSIKYDNAPMPHSIFFYGGYAIHGTTEISKLGKPASHGCVRLHPDNARTLFDLVRLNGMTNTRITISN